MSDHGNRWERLRDLEPPLGAKRRVRGQIDDVLAAAPSRRRWLVVIPAATLAVAALVVWQLRDRETSRAANVRTSVPGTTPTPELSLTPLPTPRANASVGAGTRDRTSSDVAPPPRPMLRVRKNERVALDTARAKVDIHGPASVAVLSDSLRVDRGTVTIDGDAMVSAPMCEARVAGRAQVAVTASAVRVHVFAGTAEIVPANAACTVVREELGLTTTPAGTGSARKAAAAGTNSAASSARVNVPDAKPAAPPTPTTQVTPVSPVTASALRQQIDEYRRAQAMTGHAAAVDAWRSWLARWPHSPLRVEALRAMAERQRRAQGRHP